MVLNCSKDIFIIAVIGAANNTPITPHSNPQKISAKMIVTGCNLRAEPIIFGSIKSPIIIFIPNFNIQSLNSAEPPPGIITFTHLKNLILKK